RARASLLPLVWRLGEPLCPGARRASLDKVALPLLEPGGALLEVLRTVEVAGLVGEMRLLPVELRFKGGELLLALVELGGTRHRLAGDLRLLADLALEPLGVAAEPLLA